MIDKELIKNNLTTEEVFSIVDSFSGDPAMTKFGFTAETICHNHPQDTNSRKLYYYNNILVYICQGILIFLALSHCMKKHQ